MLRRHLRSVRAWSAAGLLTCSFLAAVAPAGEPSEPIPGADQGAQAVGILAARDAGQLALDVRGAGESSVRLAIRNLSPRRLNVVLPPGLVAASSAGQAFQSMGLGAATNRAGGFGQFRGGHEESPGFQSVPVADSVPVDGVTVPAGQMVELAIPAVCLNFGLPTPTPLNSFVLMDVADYSPNPRVQKALRTLATVGTSQGVAQAVMWNVCDGLSWRKLDTQSAKRMNSHEIALAARFVEALDSAGTSDLVDPQYLTEGRIFVQVKGEGELAKDARRLESELDGQRILGLPVRVVGEGETPKAPAPAMLLTVTLTGGSEQARGHVAVSHATKGRWSNLGTAKFQGDAAPGDLQAAGLSKSLDRAIASAFVGVKTVRKSGGSTTVRIENKLPFTLAHVVLNVGNEGSTAPVALTGVGVGPARNTLAPIQAARGAVERVEFNGL
jgi:hypothetical protein